MTTEITFTWKDKSNRIENFFSSIEKCFLEKHSLAEEREQLMKKSYFLLCDYLRIELAADDKDPLVKIEEEKNDLKEKIKNLREEVKRLNETKYDWRTKLSSKKSELVKIEKMRDDPNLGTDVQSKNNFKVLSKFLNVSYQTDQESQATAVLFKNCNRQIRFDHNKSNQRKMDEFWKLLEYISRKET